MQINRFNKFERTYTDSSTGQRTQGITDHKGLAFLWNKAWGNVVDIPINGQILHYDKRNLTDWLKAGGITANEIRQARTPQAWIDLISKSLNQ